MIKWILIILLAIISVVGIYLIAVNFLPKQSQTQAPSYQATPYASSTPYVNPFPSGTPTSENPFVTPVPNDNANPFSTSPSPDSSYQNPFANLK